MKTKISPKLDFENIKIAPPVSPYTLRDGDLFLHTSPEQRKYILKIRDLPAEAKPREKLLLQGASSLSLHELLAVVLMTGTLKEDVLELSRRILREYGEKSIISEKNPTRLGKELDIPIVKACQIVAIGELTRRFNKKSEGFSIIRSAEDVFNHVVDTRHLSKEHLRGLYLNSHHQVIHDEIISIGTVDSNIVHPREVFRPALEYRAVAVVLVHNHPSGIVAPSSQDIAITDQLIKAGELMGIHVLDHVVVTGKTFTSIAAHY